jgi:hypothetical protein
VEATPCGLLLKVIILFGTPLLGLALLCFEVSCAKFIWIYLRYFILRMSILAPLERWM